MSIKKVLFALVGLVTGIQVSADDTFYDNGFTYSLKGNKSSLVLESYQAIPGKDYSLPLHIPASVRHNGKTYSVWRIDSKAFKGVTEVQSIVIDEGIENIGNYAFECCTNLKSISLPASVESIGEGVFGSCYNLTSIVVDENNECYDSRDNSNAIIDSDNDELLAACPSTKIPSSVRIIGNRAFFHCNIMEDLVIPEGVKIIGDEVFYGCSSLKSICLPETLTEIGGNAFEGCNTLTSIVIPKNVTKIFNNIFAGCYNLTSIMVDSANPTYDSRSDCNGIVRKADSALIATCRTTTITNDIKALDGECFRGTVIHSVNIPKTLTNISDYAFIDCYWIDTINVESNHPIYTSPKGSNALLSKDGKTLLLGCRTTIIPESTESIGDNAFWGRYPKLVLLIPKHVRTIGYSAFRNCNALSEVIIPKTVQTIKSEAFYGCMNLSVVQINAPLKSIYDYTFSNCYSLYAVSLPEGLETIENHAFDGCKNLKHITIPPSVTKIDKHAFKGCPNYIKSD